jgi:hypothetical protein
MRKRKKEKKLSIKKHNILRFGLGSLSHKKEEKNYQKGAICRQKLKDTLYGTDMFIVLSLYPKKFGYSLGGYSHRERYHAPDRNKSTERRRVEVDNKEPAGGQMV